MKKIQIFDLDNTLIDMDSDYRWKFFAVEKGLAESDAVARAEAFYRDYEEGKLDIDAFLDFQLAEFRGRTVGEVAKLAGEFFEKYVLPAVRRDAVAAVKKAIDAGCAVAVLSSTCDAIVRPAAEYFGISDVIGTRLEEKEGRYTGKISGVYAIGRGKIAAAAAFCRKNGASFDDVCAYGDSVNDICLLEQCGEAVAVNPAPALREAAEKNRWTIASWK